MHRKKTLRRMSPLTRKYARAVDDAEKAVRRLRAFIDIVQDLETTDRAERRASANTQGQGPLFGADVDQEEIDN